MSRIIVLVTPVFLAAILLEWWWAKRQGRSVFHLPDAITSIHLGMLSQVVGVLTPVFNTGIYAAVLHGWGASSHPFWHSAAGYAVALVLYDFCYYWFHRISHERTLLWAAHVVHHSSRDYNLSTALRQTSTGFLWAWVFYLPLALLGVPLVVFATVALIDLLYQFWVHTQMIGRLGWFDRWFCSPSNHRVHHATNPQYLDKNYGGISLVWDHWFGTYCAEDPGQPCVYGTVTPLGSLQPVWANVSVYAQLWRDLRQTPRWSNKARALWGRTGWHPPGVTLPQPPSNPVDWAQLTPDDAVRAQIGFGLSLMTVAWVLWMAPLWPAPWLWAGLLGLGVWLWGLARWLTRAGTNLEIHQAQ
jgi:alkylglycerol monooxygenase